MFEEVFTLPQSILSSSSSLQTLQNECLQLVKILSPRYMPIVLSHLSRALEKLQISKEYHGLLSVIAELLPGLCLASRVGSDSLGHFIRYEIPVVVYYVGCFLNSVVSFVSVIS